MSSLNLTHLYDDAIRPEDLVGSLKRGLLEWGLPTLAVTWSILLVCLLRDLLSPLHNPYKDLRRGMNGRAPRKRKAARNGLSDAQRTRLDLAIYLVSVVLLGGALAGVYYNSVLTNASRSFFREWVEVVDSLFGRGMDQIEGGKDLVTGLNSVLKTAAESRCPDIAAAGNLIDPAAADTSYCGLEFEPSVSKAVDQLCSQEQVLTQACYNKTLSYVALGADTLERVQEVVREESLSVQVMVHYYDLLRYVLLAMCVRLSILLAIAGAVMGLSRSYFLACVVQLIGYPTAFIVGLTLAVYMPIARLVPAICSGRRLQGTLASGVQGQGGGEVVKAGAEVGLAFFFNCVSPQTLEDAGADASSTSFYLDKVAGIVEDAVTSLLSSFASLGGGGAASLGIRNAAVGLNITRDGVDAFLSQVDGQLASLSYFLALSGPGGADPVLVPLLALLRQLLSFLGGVTSLLSCGVIRDLYGAVTSLCTDLSRGALGAQWAATVMLGALVALLALAHKARRCYPEPYRPWTCPQCLRAFRFYASFDVHLAVCQNAPWRGQDAGPCSRGGGGAEGAAAGAAVSPSFSADPRPEALSAPPAARGRNFDGGGGGDGGGGASDDDQRAKDDPLVGGSGAGAIGAGGECIDVGSGDAKGSSGDARGGMEVAAKSPPPVPVFTKLVRRGQVMFVQWWREDHHRVCARGWHASRQNMLCDVACLYLVVWPLAIGVALREFDVLTTSQDKRYALYAATGLLSALAGLSFGASYTLHPLALRCALGLATVVLVALLGILGTMVALLIKCGRFPNYSCGSDQDSQWVVSAGLLDAVWGVLGAALLVSQLRQLTDRREEVKKLRRLKGALDIATLRGAAAG